MLRGEWALGWLDSGFLLGLGVLVLAGDMACCRAFRYLDDD